MRNILAANYSQVMLAIQQANSNNSTTSALTNRGFANATAGGGTFPVVPTAGSALYIAAVRLVPRVSGIFQGSMSFTYTGATATDTFEWTVGTVTAPTAPAYTGAVQAGPNAFVGNGPGGITFSIEGATLLAQYDSGAQVQGTGATTGQFSWSGTIDASVTALVETPFTLGHSVDLVITLNRSAASMVFSGMSISFNEAA